MRTAFATWHLSYLSYQQCSGVFSEARSMGFDQHPSINAMEPASRACLTKCIATQTLFTLFETLSRNRFDI